MSMIYAVRRVQTCVRQYLSDNLKLDLCTKPNIQETLIINHSFRISPFRVDFLVLGTHKAQFIFFGNLVIRKGRTSFSACKSAFDPQQLNHFLNFAELHYNNSASVERTSIPALRECRTRSLLRGQDSLGILRK